MDPDRNLERIRELVNLAGDREKEDKDLDAADTYELVDRIRSLDEWLSKGGYLPVAWLGLKGG